MIRILKIRMTQFNEIWLCDLYHIHVGHLWTVTLWKHKITGQIIRVNYIHGGETISTKTKNRFSVILLICMYFWEIPIDIMVTRFVQRHVRICKSIWEFSLSSCTFTGKMEFYLILLTNIFAATLPIPSSHYRSWLSGKWHKNMRNIVTDKTK